MSKSIQAKVLVVDDDASLSGSIATLLENAHYDVTRARSRMSSLTTLLDSRFDVVLLDLNLGTGDLEGLQVIESARRTGIRIPPIVVMSGSAKASIEAAAAALGTKFYIRKPFSGEELQGVVAKALQKA